MAKRNRRNGFNDGDEMDAKDATGIDNAAQTADTATAVDESPDTVASGETNKTGEGEAKKKTRSSFYVIVETDQTGAIGETLWQGKSRRSAEKFIASCRPLLKRSFVAVAILRVKPFGVTIL